MFCFFFNDRVDRFPMLNTDPFFSRGSTNHALKNGRVFGAGGTLSTLCFFDVPAFPLQATSRVRFFRQTHLVKQSATIGKGSS